MSATFWTLGSTTASKPTGIKGNVHDEYGMPIVMATVMIDPKTGTTTDLSGNFSLNCSPKISHRVVVSCVGYISDTLTVPVIRGVMSEVTVVLKEDIGAVLIDCNIVTACLLLVCTCSSAEKSEHLRLNAGTEFVDSKCLRCGGS